MTMELREQYLLLRRKKKIKHIDVASYVGVSQAMISYFELGKKNMSDKYVNKYVEYINQK